ncbi:hypothetical protein [Pseudonocardia sp. N23]|uniref:hypothetical protein n=1 Tax=Pseudonocardia sp. N23 TaxID=1987376 RepID=UPI000BFD956A|nr:hypothetical protein [Pseudonocardia sp. N23]GAY12726.1 hypothetical protein TOK_1276 [Pseudonocardia sp. N23]
MSAVRHGRARHVLAVLALGGVLVATSGCGVTVQREPERLDMSVLAPAPTPTVTVVPESPDVPTVDEPAPTPTLATAPLPSSTTSVAAPGG